MDKLTAIRIKYDDGTYSEEIPVSALAEDIIWNSSHNLVDILGEVDLTKGNIQQQLNEKFNSDDISTYVDTQISTDVTAWLNEHVNPVGSAVVVDNSLTTAGAAADAKKVGDELGTLNERFDNVLDDRNKQKSNIYTENYNLINAAIVDGVIQPNVFSMVATEEYIDCRGIKRIKILNGSDRWVYFSWYSAPNENAFVSNSGRWCSESDLALIPVADYLRITVRKADGSVVEPSFAFMTIETTGIIDYCAILDAKQSEASHGYHVLRINDNFVKGGISPTGGIAQASTSICTNDYIDTSNLQYLQIDVPNGYNVAVVFFENQGEAEVSRQLAITGKTKVSVKNGYNFAKIALYKNTNIYTGESFELSVYGLAYCHGVTGDEYVASGSVIYNNFEPAGEINISATSATTVIVTNENMLIQDFYESGKTVNGITFTVNDNGSITANGTATGNADFYFRTSSAPTINLINTPLFFSCLSKPSDDYFAYLNGSSQADLGEGVIVSLVPNRARLTSGYIRIRDGRTVDNVVFYPQIKIGTRKTSYVVSRGSVYTGVTQLTVNAMRNQTIIYASDTINVSGKLSVTRAINKKYEDVVAERKQHGWRSNNHVISICHRGYLTEAPENTIYAFRAAVADDIDYLESDIWFTSDHVPVMFHDPTINRVVTGHTGTIRDYTWAEVQTFDVSTYFQEQYPSKWKPEYSNARIMSFEEYLKFCKGVNTPSMLEIKDPNCSESERQTVINLIRKYDFSDCILWFGSLTSYPNLYSVIAAFPNAILNLGVDGTSVSQYHINLLNTLRTGENNVGIATDNYTENDVAICKTNSVPLTVYMIDTLQQALALDPYIHAALSNNQNVGKVLKSYYMGE